MKHGRMGLWLWLVVLWVGLWRNVSVANVVTGAVAAGSVLLAFPPADGGERRVVRPGAALAFQARFVRDLVVSTAVVAWTVVSPARRLTTGIIEVPMRCGRPGIMTLVANAITLTPGTLTVDVRSEPPTLFVHVLNLRDLDAARRSVIDLEARVIRAFGTDDEVARLEGPAGEARR